jgi:hypothetical protein
LHRARWIPIVQSYDEAFSTLNPTISRERLANEYRRRKWFLPVCSIGNAVDRTDWFHVERALGLFSECHCDRDAQSLGAHVVVFFIQIAVEVAVNELEPSVVASRGFGWPMRWNRGTT